MSFDLNFKINAPGPGGIRDAIVERYEAAVARKVALFVDCEPDLERRERLREVAAQFVAATTSEVIAPLVQDLADALKQSQRLLAVLEAISASRSSQSGSVN